MRTNILAKEGYGSFEVGTAIPMGNDNIGNTVSRGPAVTYDEGNGAGPDTIVMTGPLGEVYTKALSIHFAKSPLENVLAEETQVMDAAYQSAAIFDNVELGLKEIADAVQLKTSNDEILGNVSATVFAVDQTMMNRPEVIDAVEKLRDKANEQGIDYVMAVCVDPLRNISPVYMDSNSTYYGIHDHTVNAENAGKIFNRATECYCASQGMNVVFGMEGLAIWLTDKYKGKANYAQEGFTGFLAGFFASGVVGLPGVSSAIGAGVKATLESKKREIEKVAGEIQKLKLQGAKAALDQGRISEGRYKTETKMEVPDIVKGAIMGAIPFVASIYNGVNASKLQDASEDLNKKIRELEELMRAHGIDGKKKSKDSDGIVTTEEYVEESFSAFLSSVFSSGVLPIPGSDAVAGGLTRATLEAKKREIEKIADEIYKIKKYGAKAALDEGRISEGRYKSEVKIDGADIIQGTIYGSIPFVSSIYIGKLNNEIHRQNNLLKKKLAELNKLMIDNDLIGKKKSKDDGDHEYR